MANYKTVSTLVVDCSDWGFGPFEVLIVPGVCQGHPCYDCYLRHPKYGPVMDMGGFCDSEEEAEMVEMAYNMAIDYIPDYNEKVVGYED